ncbi:hypothetical protein D3C77_429530 [compost metagenome]
MPPVCLQLALAGAARADPAAESGQIFAVTRQSRQQIAELRQLHLDNAFTRLCALGKNIQNQLRPIDNFNIKQVLQITHLST